MAADAAASEAPSQVLMISTLPSASSTLKPVQGCSVGKALALSHTGALSPLPFAEGQVVHPSPSAHSCTAGK